jgi:hypothetical protein
MAICLKPRGIRLGLIPFLLAMNSPWFEAHVPAR